MTPTRFVSKSKGATIDVLVEATTLGGAINRSMPCAANYVATHLPVQLEWAPRPIAAADSPAPRPCSCDWGTGLTVADQLLADIKALADEDTRPTSLAAGLERRRASLVMA